MKTITNKLFRNVATIAATIILLSACNKKLPDPTPILYPDGAGQSIGDFINTDANYSIFKALLTRAGVLPAITAKTSEWTIFAADNAAMTLSGMSSDAIVNSLPVATATAIANYHIISGRTIKSTDISTAFPNVQYVTNFIFPSPNTNPLARFSNFPSRRSAGAWLNNIPIKAVDKILANGVLHTVGAIAAPPSQVMMQILAADPKFNYFLAAVTRADQTTGATPLLGGSSGILANPLANLTLFAPDSNAFKTVLAALGLPPAISSINLMPAATVRGLLFYHLMGTRVFKENLAAGASSVPSLAGAALPNIDINNGTTTTVRGPGNVLPTTPATPYAATITQANVHAINGTIHVINQVLRPN
jgi:uncharacterized surface protein with fasciclin (FAS1) repeats